MLERGRSGRAVRPTRRPRQTPREPRAGTFRSPWARVVLLALLVVMALVVVLDQVWLRGEEKAVASCQARAADATRYADARLESTATYLAPARLRRPYGLGDLTSTLMGEAALGGRPAVARAAAACEEVEVRGWHSGPRQRREAVLAYLEARLDSLAAIIEDGDRYYQSNPDLQPLRDAAFPGDGD